MVAIGDVDWSAVSTMDRTGFWTFSDSFGRYLICLSLAVLAILVCFRLWRNHCSHRLVQREDADVGYHSEKASVSDAGQFSPLMQPVTPLPASSASELFSQAQHSQGLSFPSSGQVMGALMRKERLAQQAPMINNNAKQTGIWRRKSLPGGASTQVQSDVTEIFKNDRNELWRRRTLHFGSLNT